MSATKTAREEKGKTSFIIECDDLKVIAGFTHEQKGKVLTYITDFAMNDKEPDITTVEGMAASFFTKTIEKYNQRYLEICQKNADNRNKGKGKKDDDKKEKPNGHIPQSKKDDFFPEEDSGMKLPFE